MRGDVGNILRAARPVRQHIGRLAYGEDAKQEDPTH